MRTAIRALILATASVAALSVAHATPLTDERLIEFEASDHSVTEAYRGEIFVPENRADPESRIIRIEYVRFPATGDTSGPPIIYLSGGPGGSGINTAKGPRFPLFMAMREFGDVIALDQRGTGASNDIEVCHASLHNQDDSYVSDRDFLSRQRLALDECFERWTSDGVDIAGYNTLENVADIDALRMHLGAEKVSLWGISYGSHLALAALKEMEDRIDRIVIASAEGLDQTIKLPARTDDYFDRFGSAIGHEDLPGLIRRVHAQLDVAPPRLQLTNRNGESLDFLLQKRDMQRIASAMISDPDRAKMLVGLYEALDTGNTGPVTGLMSRFVRPNEPISFNLMSVAMDIASGTSADRRALIERQAQSSLLGPFLNQSVEFEDTAPELVLSDSFRVNPVSDVPVLLLSGTLDGRTYLQSQIEAVSGLSNLDHMIVEGAGHNLFMWSPDVTNRIQSFMRRAPSSDISTPEKPSQ